MPAPAQCHTWGISAAEFVHKQVGFLTVLSLLGILQLVQTYTAQQRARHGTAAKEATPAQSTGLPVQLGHVLTLKEMFGCIPWFAFESFLTGYKGLIYHFHNFLSSFIILRRNMFRSF